MLAKKYKKYTSNFPFHNHLYDILSQQEDKKDHRYMVEQLKTHNQYLTDHGIYMYMDFSDDFKKYLIQRIEEVDMISSFIDNNRQIFLLKKRELNKASSSERNVLYNRLFLQCPLEFLNHVKNYIKTNRFKKFGYMDINKQINLISDIKLKIEYLQRHQKNEINMVPNEQAIINNNNNEVINAEKSTDNLPIDISLYDSSYLSDENELTDLNNDLLTNDSIQSYFDYNYDY